MIVEEKIYKMEVFRTIVSKAELKESKMKKFGNDPKVKKTLVRDCEQKIKLPTRKLVVHDVGPSSRMSAKASGSSLKENDLSKPTICSSQALANQISNIKLSAPPSLKTHSLNIDQSKISSKVTKKLNFHYNDRIYRNLIELNANVDEVRKKKDKKPISPTKKRDLEPNIEDFAEEITDQDSPPNIPVMKPKFRMVKKIEHGQLHKLILSFENL